MQEVFEEYCRLGQVIAGRYRVEKVLGSGGMGWVLLVKDRALNDELVALKLLYPHLLADGNSYARFRNETQIAMRFSHPNIVQTYGFGEFEDLTYFLSMEYVDGETLRDKLSPSGEHGLPLEACVSYIYQISLGLRYAHLNGVIHRDLKPDNILTDSSNRAKIADFGLARTLREEAQLTKFGAILGTPRYMSPEQLRSEVVDSRSDIYSLGIIAYELFSGAPPFDDNSFVNLARKHLSEVIPKLEPGEDGAAPEWYTKLIERCTAKDKTERYSTIEEVLAVLKSRIDPESDLLIDRQQNVSILSTPSVPRVETRTERVVRWAPLILIVSYLIVFVCCANLIDSVNKRTARSVLISEKSYDIDLSYLRKLLGIEVSLDDWHLLFIDSSREYQRGGWPLIEAGVNLNFHHPETGETPLTYRIKSLRSIHSIRPLKLLLKNGADPNLKNANDSAPIHVAMSMRHSAVIQTLLAVGASPNQQMANGDTALHQAVRSRSVKFVQLLLSHGTDTDIANLDGNTALHLAALDGELVIVRILIAAGADPDLKNGAGLTPRDLLPKRWLSEVEIRELVGLLK